MVEIITGLSAVPRAMFSFKIVISRVGVFITLCVLVVPESLSGRPGFHHTRFCTNMVGKKAFCAADRGFLRHVYEIFSLL